MSKIRLAIIGAGRHAQSHYSDPAFVDSDEIELCAACDLDTDKLKKVKEKFSVPKCYTDYREMILKEKPAGVIVVIRPMELTDLAIDCIKMKQNLLIEKPPGCGLDDAKKILAAAEKYGCKVMVSVNRRFYPIIRYLREELIANQPIVSCVATYNKSGFAGDTWKWPAPLAVADAIHTIDLICYFGGRATQVYAVTAERNADFVNSVSAVAVLESGGFATINNHQCVGFRKQLFEVHTQRVSAYLDISEENNPRCELFLDNHALDCNEIIKKIGTSYSEQLHFARWIRGNSKCIADLKDVINSVALAEAVAKGYKGKING